MVIMMSNIIRRDPLAGFLSWPRWLEDINEDFGLQRGLKIHETDKDIIIEAVVAGVPADDVEIHIEDGVLTIKAEVSEEKKNEGEFSALRRQYYYNTALSGGKWDKAVAEIEDGVVKIRIPKTEAVKPRKITVTKKSKK